MTMNPVSVGDVDGEQELVKDTDGSDEGAAQTDARKI